MSNLVEHAERELAAMKVEEPERSSLIGAVKAFAEGGWSGGGAAWGIPILKALLEFKNLTPLTDDPGEWNDIAEVGPEDQPPGVIWQSRRNPEAFSLDGGKHYYLLSEREAAGGTVGTQQTPNGPLVLNDGLTAMHISESHS